MTSLVVYSSTVATALLTLVSIEVVAVLVLHGRIPKSVVVDLAISAVVTIDVMIFIPVLLRMAHLLLMMNDLLLMLRMNDMWVVIALIVTNETLLLKLLLHLLLLLLKMALPWLLLEFRWNSTAEYIFLLL